MATNFYTTPNKDRRTPPYRRTGCTTCDEGYMTFIPPPRDPSILRQEFRRRPFDAPRRAPLYVLDSLNHADIASLPPAIQPGQEGYPSLTYWQRQKLARAGGKKGGNGVPDDNEGWGTIFLHNFFLRGFVALLAWFIGWLSIFAVPTMCLFDLVGDGPFLPVFAACSVCWYVTSPAFDSFWLGTAVLLGLLGTIAMTVTKLVLGR
ncbi:hypothetical protein OCU04_009495 [Sclerotinia nivalis]|uniref:Uncharacterized protein n=1 Tax=Sclerotinia nivalis TaxID=352851 RepID=A0A9X0DGK9_9HELO|nr:hypothetical protein OCU04_009495 [Sclerotinia nivalis]